MDQLFVGCCLTAWGHNINHKHRLPFFSRIGTGTGTAKVLATAVFEPTVTSQIFKPLEPSSLELFFTVFLTQPKLHSILMFRNAMFTALWRDL